MKGALEKLKQKDASGLDLFRTIPFQNMVKNIGAYFDNYEKELDDFINRRIADLNKLNLQISSYIEQKSRKTEVAKAKITLVENLRDNITKEKNGLEELFKAVRYRQ